MYLFPVTIFIQSTNLTMAHCRKKLTTVLLHMKGVKNAFPTDPRACVWTHAWICTKRYGPQVRYVFNGKIYNLSEHSEDQRSVLACCFQETELEFSLFALSVCFVLAATKACPVFGKGANTPKVLSALQAWAKASTRLMQINTSSSK